MKTIEETKVPEEVKEELARINKDGWIASNDCVYYPNGGYYANRSAKAIVYHQLENRAYSIIDRYET